MHSVRHFILLLQCILLSLATITPALNIANLTLPSFNTSSTSLGRAQFLGLALPVSNAYLYINYFDDAPIPREALLSTLGPARRETLDLVARFGPTTELRRPYKWGSPGCWFTIDNWAETLRRKVTYGMMKEVIDVLYLRMIALEKIQFVLYIDILEGQNEYGARIGEAVMEDTKPMNWDVTSYAAAENVAAA